MSKQQRNKNLTTFYKKVFKIVITFIFILYDIL